MASWHRPIQSQLGSSEYLSRQRRFATTIGSAPQHDRYIHDRIVLRNRETLSAAGRRSRNYLQRLGGGGPPPAWPSLAGAVRRFRPW